MKLSNKQIVPPLVNGVRLPLVFDGQKLSIPRASATQDGYLSRGDFVLFSGGQLVPVTSFNTRTGEVILLEDDVLAALGYVPLNRHGDTMTGPLQLSGAPTASLHAATKAYVDASRSGAAIGTYAVSVYGASGSKLTFSGTIAAGALTRLTVTLASDFAVGQGIFIASAGPSAKPLITTVSAIDATKKIITLATAATVPVTSVKVQHDDTVAIQAAIDACSAAGGGTVFFDDLYGWYRINKGFSDINSILKIPFTPWIGAGATTPPPPPMIRFKGNGNNVAAVASPAVTLGPIIQTDLVGANSSSSMLSSGVYSVGTVINGNCMTVSVEGLTFRTYDNPNICGLDFGNLWNLFLKDVLVDVGMPAEANSWLGGSLPGASQPTHGTFGIRLPRINACTVVDTNNVAVANFGIGIIGSELWHCNNTWVIRCAVGVQTHETYSNYPITGNLLIVQCPTMMQWLAPVPVDLHIEFESDTSGWWLTPPGHFLYDPSNFAKGLIKYLAISPGGGNVPITTTGLANLSLWSLGGFGIRIADDLNLGGDIAVQDLTASGEVITDSLETDSIRLATQAVGVGANDSAGSGNRVLLVPNDGAFDRLAVPGLVIALKGDAITGLSDGASITTWPDSGPHGYHGMSSAPNKPTYHSSVVNGRAVVRFAGSHCVTLPFPGSLAQPCTYYFVLNESVSNTGGWLDSYSNLSARNLLQVPSSLLSGEVMPATVGDQRDINAYQMYAGNIIEGGTRVKGSFVILEVIFDGAASQLSVNGSVVLSGDAGNQPFVDGVLGCVYAATDFFTGDIAEFLFYGTVSDPNRASIRASLGAYYGITTS